MNRFDAAATCPKCGNTDIGSSFHGRWRSPCHYGCPGYEPSIGRTVEHILRTCRRCHYEWAEEPLDGSPENPATEEVEVRG